MMSAVRTGASWGGGAKKVVVIINPVAGTGRSRKVFDMDIMPVLEAAGLEVDVQVTSRAGEASGRLQPAAPRARWVL